METYALNVGGDKRHGDSWHAHNHSLVSGIAEQRQATHEHMSNVDINGQARSQTQAHELSGSLTCCEDAQNRRRHPDRSRTKKIVSVSQTALRYACGWVCLTDKQSTTKKLWSSWGHLRPVKIRRKCRMNEVVSRQFLTHTVSKINQRSDATLHSR